MKIPYFQDLPYLPNLLLLEDLPSITIGRDQTDRYGTYCWSDLEFIFSCVSIVSLVSLVSLGITDTYDSKIENLILSKFVRNGIVSMSEWNSYIRILVLIDYFRMGIDCIRDLITHSDQVFSCLSLNQIFYLPPILLQIKFPNSDQNIRLRIIRQAIPGLSFIDPISAFTLYRLFKFNDKSVVVIDIQMKILSRQQDGTLAVTTSILEQIFKLCQISSYKILVERKSVQPGDGIIHLWKIKKIIIEDTRIFEDNSHIHGKKDNIASIHMLQMNNSTTSDSIYKNKICDRYMSCQDLDEYLWERLSFVQITI